MFSGVLYCLKVPIRVF